MRGDRWGSWREHGAKVQTCLALTLTVSRYSLSLGPSLLLAPQGAGLEGLPCCLWACALGIARRSALISLGRSPA